MLVIVLPMIVVATAPICSAFGLKRRFNLHELGSEANKHVFDHVIGPDEKGILANFGRKVAIP